MSTIDKPSKTEKLSIPEQIKALENVRVLENFLSEKFPKPESLIDCSNEEYNELSGAILERFGDLGLKMLDAYCDKIFNGGDDGC